MTSAIYLFISRWSRYRGSLSIFVVFNAALALLYSVMFVMTINIWCLESWIGYKTLTFKVCLVVTQYDLLVHIGVFESGPI